MFTSLFAYLGPETMLPLTSAVAAVVGGFMMFGRGLGRIVLGTIRLRFGRRKVNRVNSPHFRAKQTIEATSHRTDD